MTTATGQQVYVLVKEKGKLVLGDQFIYGSKSIIYEGVLKGAKAVERTVHFDSGPRKVTVLVVGEGMLRIYWIREGDLS